MQWLNAIYQLMLPWLPVITLSGLIMGIASTIAIPWLILRMPADYFVTRKRPKLDRSLLGWLILIGRNVVAVILLVAGLIMLLLPGQGLLTILIAIGEMEQKYG
ncbi:MAG: hypothetical protein CVV10_07655, partial [Gammaproteobacteria bacterium HGW-Gammaproteobacteria-14]